MEDEPLPFSTLHDLWPLLSLTVNSLLSNTSDLLNRLQCPFHAPEKMNAFFSSVWPRDLSVVPDFSGDESHAVIFCSVFTEFVSSICMIQSSFSRQNCLDVFIFLRSKWIWEDRTGIPQNTADKSAFALHRASTLPVFGAELKTDLWLNVYSSRIDSGQRRGRSKKACDF